MSAPGRELAALDVLWFEEPVRPMRNRSAIAEVARATAIDLAAGENQYALQDFEALLAPAAGRGWTRR